MPCGHHLLQILGNIGSIMLNSTFISSYVWSKKSIIHTEYKFLLVQKIYYIYFFIYIIYIYNIYKKYIIYIFFQKYFNCTSAVNWMNKQGQTLKCFLVSNCIHCVDSFACFELMNIVLCKCTRWNWEHKTVMSLSVLFVAPFWKQNRITAHHVF